MKKIRKRLTYANVMSSIAVFLVLGGATAIAADQLGKNSVGKKQLKASAVTTAKLKKNAVTTAKIKNGAVTGAKIADGSVTGTEINAATLGTVPNSATTNVVRAGKGVLSGGQEVTVLEHGPLRLTVKCHTIGGGNLAPQVFISSSADGSVFSSWRDGLKNLGPGTAEEDREVTGDAWSDSSGAYEYDGPEPVSASAAGGQAFNAFIGVAAEKDTNTCWYWMNATIIS